MLLVNATNYDNGEMEELIAEQCSEFGFVTDVEICRNDDPYRYDLAIVEMSSGKEASKVVKQLGGKEFGSSVLLQIYHEGKLLRGPQTLH
jgi:hypothetical protein